MAYESSAITGSGISVLRYPGLPFFRGSNVAVINPEDMICGIGIFAASGFSVNSSSTTNLTITPLSGRRKLMVFNLGPQTVFVGNSGITTSTGYPIPSGNEKLFDVLAYGGLFAISAGTSDVRILQIA